MVLLSQVGTRAFSGVDRHMDRRVVTASRVKGSGRYIAVKIKRQTCVSCFSTACYSRARRSRCALRSPDSRRSHGREFH